MQGAHSGFKKLAVQWLNEHLSFVSSVVLADSFVLRNRQLLKPAKRYRKPYDDTAKMKLTNFDRKFFEIQWTTTYTAFNGNRTEKK
jgi:hypothetical protein